MKRCRRYAFPHKSFQEIFAAYYLCCELLEHENTSESLVSDAAYFSELKQVLLFLCGILTVQCEERAVDLITNITTQVNRFGQQTVPITLECIAESKREQNNVHVKLARVFGSGLKLQNARVEDITLRKVHIASVAEAMRVNTTLTKLALTNNNIDAAGAASLAEATKVNTTLTKLLLSHNNIGDAGAASLAKAMKVNKTLTQLYLTRNNIGDAGTASLAEAMKVNTTLTKLDLSSNDIGAAGAASLAEAIEVNTTLTQVELSNSNIGAAGAAFLAEAMKFNTTVTIKI